MTQKIREIMTPGPIALDATASVIEAAQAMKEHGIGDVLVLTDGEICGLVTDRDLAVRVLAEALDPRTTALGDVCSREPLCLGPDDDVDRAVELVRAHAIRRIPIVEDTTAVGMISIGDLAIDRDAHSALAEVSAAPANL